MEGSDRRYTAASVVLVLVAAAIVGFILGALARGGTVADGRRVVTDPTVTSSDRLLVAEGVWLVGTDIPSGRYESDGPVKGLCYVGVFADTDQNNLVTTRYQEGGIMRITVADGQVMDNNCGTLVGVTR